MSLFFKERIDEQIEDVSKDTITFVPSCVLRLPITNEEEDQDADDFEYSGRFRTTYNIFSARWNLYLTTSDISIYSFSNEENGYPTYGWNGSCFISYKLYYDRDMRFELYSSPIVSALPSNIAAFKTPNGFMTKFHHAFEKVAAIIIFAEILLPTKYFFYPSDNPNFRLSMINNCDEYPKEMENDYRFEFLKDSDFSIHCPDGSISALKCALNLTSKFMKQHFKKSKDDKLVVEHSIDVIKPLIWYLHSLCFEMPKSFNLDFAERLLKAIKFFEPVQKSDFIASIYQALCNKFFEETPDFNTLLRWMSVAQQPSFRYLREMICTVISNKYYYKWHQTFPENAQNTQNPIFRDIFGPQGDIFETFKLIQNIFLHSYLCKVIFH